MSITHDTADQMQQLNPRPDTRPLYGHPIGIAEFRRAYFAGNGFCRGCKRLQASIAPMGRGLECPDCGARRVFSALEFAKNGWIAKLRPGRRSDRSIERLLSCGDEVGGGDVPGRCPATMYEDRSRQ